MRVRGWGRVLLAAALLITGCSSSDSDDGSGGYYGGQTGSLKPCSTPADLGSGSVPSGDAAFVFHTGCSNDGLFGVTDANGDPVPFEVVELDGGVVLLRTEEALTQGSYQVSTPDGGEQTLSVGEVAPLPSKLGVLSRAADPCSTLFNLDLDPEVLPYLPLLRLEYAVDGASRSTWFEYGTATYDQGPLSLEVPEVPLGRHELQVFASIAGEATAPAPESLSFTRDCSGAGADDGFSCHVASPATTAGNAHVRGLFVCLLLGLVGLARRRRQPDV